MNDNINIYDHYGLIRAELTKYPAEYRDELEQAGVVGLVKALHAYSEDKGSFFSTYAHTKVRYSILNAFQQLTKHGELRVTPFTDVEAHIGDEMSFEEVVTDSWKLEDHVSGLSDASVILDEVDGLENKLQRITLRYLSGIRGHARIKNVELAEILGLPAMHVTRTYYRAKKQLKTRQPIIELAREKRIIK